MEAILRYNPADWMTVIVVICLLLLTTAKLINSARFEELVLLAVTNKYFLVHGKNNTIISAFNILLLIVQILSASLFIYLLFDTISPDIHTGNPYLFIQIVAGYTLFISLKYCVEKIIANIFSIDDLIDNYLYHKLTFRNFISIFILLLNILFIYAIPYNQSVLITIVIITVIINTIALIFSYKTNEKLIMNNSFYFILYLCALEISPYYLLYRAVI